MAHRKPVRLREVKRADMKQMKATDHRTLSISSARIAAQNMTWTELSIRRLAARRGFVCEFCDERINDSGHASRPAAYERHLDRHHGLELYLRNDYVCYSCRDMTRYRSEPALMLHFVQSHRTGWFYGTPKRCRSACYAYRRRPQASQRKLNLQKTSDKTYHENVIWDHALLGNLSKLRYYCSDEERLLRALEIGTGYTRSVGQVSRIREKLMPARIGYVLPQAPRRYGSSRSLSRSNSNSSAPSRLTAAAMSEDGVSEVARPFKALITVLIDLQRQLKSQHRIRRFFFPAIRQERRKLLNFTASVIERAEKIFGVAIFVENGTLGHLFSLFMLSFNDT